MLASAVAAGLLIGLALRGNLRGLAAVRIRFLPLFIAAVALRALALVPGGLTTQHVIYTVSLWALFAAVVANVRLPGASLAALGIGSNGVAVSLSGGAMPVWPTALLAAGVRQPSDALHTVTPATSVLGDVIPIPTLGVYSPGDVLLAFGVVLFIIATMRASA